MSCNVIYYPILEFIIPGCEWGGKGANPARSNVTPSFVSLEGGTISMSIYNVALLVSTRIGLKYLLDFGKRTFVFAHIFFLQVPLLSFDGIVKRIKTLL